MLPAALPAPFSATLSPALLVYLCANVGPQGLLVFTLPAPFRPTLRQSRSRHGHASPLCPGTCLCPSYRSGCLFLFYLLGVGLPCPSIFCQFWLCEEAKCVYLRRHLGSISRRVYVLYVDIIWLGQKQPPKTKTKNRGSLFTFRTMALSRSLIPGILIIFFRSFLLMLL